LVLAGGAKNPKIVCGRGNKECGYSRGADEPSPGEGGENGEASAENGDAAAPAKAEENSGGKRKQTRPASIAP
jgi:hypothetical protein